MKQLVIHYRFWIVLLIVLFILVIFLNDSLFMEGFDNNNAIDRIFNKQYSPIWNMFDNQWKKLDEFGVNKAIPIKTMNYDIDYRNMSVSFWLFINKDNYEQNHIFSLRNNNIDKQYLGIWKDSNKSFLVIKGKNNLNSQNNQSEQYVIPSNRSVFVTITASTPIPSQDQIKNKVVTKEFQTVYTLYIDGIMRYTHIDQFDNYVSDKNIVMVIGKKNETDKAENIAIKDIKIYNTTMSHTDITNLYNAVKINNDPDGAKQLFSSSMDGFTTYKNNNEIEGFVTADQCTNVIMPVYKDFFDFYKNVKVLMANGEPCKYNYSSDAAPKQIKVGPHNGGEPKVVDLTRFGINKEDEISPKPINPLDPNWTDTFRLEREGQNKEILKVYRTDGKTIDLGWGMDLVLQTETSIIQDRNFKCTSDKPICADYVPDGKLGQCASEILPFDMDKDNNAKVTFIEHYNTGWQFEMGVGMIPDMTNHNGNNYYGLSTIIIPNGLVVSIYNNIHFNGTKTDLHGPQTVKLWEQQFNGVYYNDNVRSLKVKSNKVRFQTTYNNDSKKPINNKDDWRLEQDDLLITDTLDKHFDMKQVKKKMRFIRFQSYGKRDWNTNQSFDEAKRNGVGSYFKRLQFRNLKLFLGSAGMTFCLWFKCDSDKQEQWARLIDFGDGFGKNNIVMAFNQKSIGFHISNENHHYTSDWDVVTSVNHNEWYHVAWVIGSMNSDKKCDWKIYVNGTNVDNHKNMNYPPLVSRENLLIGASNYFWDPYLHGGIADVRIYKEPLTEAQICKVYNNPDPDGPK